MRIETTLEDLFAQSEDGSVPMLDSVTGGAGAESQAMIDSLSQIPVVYVYATDDEGRVVELDIEMDMSSFFTEMMSSQPGADTSMFENTTMLISIPMTIGYDAVADITMPTDVTDDRTDRFIAAINGVDAMVEDEMTEIDEDIDAMEEDEDSADTIEGDVDPEQDPAASMEVDEDLAEQTEDDLTDTSVGDIYDTTVPDA